MAAANMACTGILVVALLFSYVALQETEGDGPYEATIRECMKELGIDESNPGANGDLRYKMLGCIMQKDGLITEDGKFSLERAFEKNKEEVEATRKKLDASVTKCADKINSGDSKTPEEIAKVVMECKKEYEASEKRQ